jgi:response regulator RpfG family c-di-GMP phosphodiesterase
MKPKILFVDDDPNILAAYRRNLRHEFEVDTTLGGALALAALETQGPYAVVVADMRMPSMDGIELLKRVQALCPDTIRIMLTGNADQRTAREAVNQGRIFRFLTKPCPAEELGATLREGVHQYELIGTERELLEQTLAGTIKVLAELLSTADPVSFGLAARAADLAEEVGRRMGLKETWSLRIGTLLAPIGLVTLPAAVLARHRSGEPLEPKERELLERVPEAGARLLARIPRLQDVARCIRHQDRDFDGADGGGSPAGAEIPVQARIMRAASDFVRCQCQRSTAAAAMAQLDRHPARYDPEVLKTLREMFRSEEAGTDGPPVFGAGLGDLRVGQVLVSPVATCEGVEILPRGTPLSFSHLEKIQNHACTGGVREPIQVFELP